MTFAVGSDNYSKMQLGFQMGKLKGIDSISINDGVQTKSVKVSDGDSGAAGALFGGLFFGPLGALVGGLGTREGAQYGEVTGTNTVGFTITYENTSHETFNVLELCLNYTYVNYHDEREVYEEAKQITVEICEELLKCVEKYKPKVPTQSVQPQTYSSPTTSGININPSNLEPTITRVELFLEDKEWEKVKDYCNAALDYFPTDYRLYLFLLFADLKVSDLEELAKRATSFSDNSNYKKVIRFGNDEIKEKLLALSGKASANAELEAAYIAANQLMNDSEYEAAYNAFVALDGYKDSNAKCQECAAKLSDAERRKSQQSRNIDIIKERADHIKALISKRNKLLNNSGDEVNTEVEEIDTELLQMADIVKTGPNSYRFEGFDNSKCRRNDTLLFNGNNEWLIIARTDNKVLFLSKYAERDKSDYSYRKECNWYSSYPNSWLNTGIIHNAAGALACIPMLSGFKCKQRSLFARLDVLSVEEVEKYLPKKESRILHSKGNDSITLEWHLKDDVKSNALKIVDKSGNITQVKNQTFMNGNYMSALRPSMWVDFTKLIPEDISKWTIEPDNQDYEYVEYEGYSLYVPKYFAEQKSTAPADGSLLLTSSNSDMFVVGTSESDAIDDNNGLHPSVIVSEESIDLGEGTLHLIVVVNNSKYIGFTQGYYKVPGEKVGLTVMAMHTLDGKHNYDPDVRKGLLNIKKL